MNGSFFSRKFSSVTVCFFLLMIFFVSCGLETLYYLDYPENGHDVSHSNADRLLDYFRFRTADSSNIDAGFDFQGTEIYYKIFNSESKIVDSIASINNVQTSSDISAAANMLINTKKYRPLISDISTSTPIVKESRATVEIRLNSYLNDNPSGIKINDVITCRPKRNISSGNKRFGFEFNKDDQNNPVPKEGDEDVEWSSSTTTDGEWYVDLWAFSAGKDTSFTWSYSKAIHLGSITIKESEYNK